MTNTSASASRTDYVTVIADRYTAVWNESDTQARRLSIAGLWASDGVEYVDGARFNGLDELHDRIACAYTDFVGSGRYLVDRADDARRHDDLVSFTIRLITPGTSEIAWAARVFLLLDSDGRIREDYQLTVQPLAGQ
jgi:hypothetical protein